MKLYNWLNCFIVFVLITLVGCAGRANPSAQITFSPQMLVLSPGESDNVVFTLSTHGNTVSDQVISLTSNDANIIVESNGPCVLNNESTSCSFSISAACDAFESTYAINITNTGNIKINPSSIAVVVPSWTYVGESNISNSNINDDIALAVDSAGVPYMAYSNATTNKLIVKKYTNNTWSQVGSVVDNIAADSKISLIFANSLNPIVIYGNNDADVDIDILKAKTFINGAWNNYSGDIGLGANQSVAVESTGVIYIAYTDYHDNLLVKKFNVGSWNIVGGNTNLSGGLASLTLNSLGVPYLAYVDEYLQIVAVYLDISNNSWLSLGSIIVSKGNEPSIAIESGTNAPYVSYSGSVDDAFFVKMFIGGTWVPAGNDENGFIDYGGNSNLVLSTDGHLYIVYLDLQSVVGVKSLQNGIWQDVGNNGAVGVTNYSNPVLAFSPTSNTAYVGYKNIIDNADDDYDSGFASVKKYP